MSVKNVSVKYIRPEGYDNLKVWMKDKKNVYIARAGVVFINGERFPKKSSIWHNPFRIGKDGTRAEVMQKYNVYMTEKLKQSVALQKELLKLKGKNLGCWCHPLPCHGDILLRLIKRYARLTK